MDEKIIDVDMTEARKAKLSALAPITPKASFLYVPAAYREKDENGEYFTPKAEWPVFELRSLTGRDRIESDSSSFGIDGSVSFSFGKMVCGVVKKGLIGWKNWRDAEGNKIKFYDRFRGRGELTAEALDYLPEPLFVEIANAIQERSELTEEEKQGL